MKFGEHAHIHTYTSIAFVIFLGMHAYFFVISVHNVMDDLRVKRGVAFMQHTQLNNGLDEEKENEYKPHLFCTFICERCSQVLRFLGGDSRICVIK